jgi:excinuclease ABC subunit A
MAPAWHGQNLRDIVTTVGYHVDKPWRELPKKDRDWLLYTEEQPVVPVYAGWDREQVALAIKRKEPPSYMGTFTGARRYMLETFSKTAKSQRHRSTRSALALKNCEIHAVLCQRRPKWERFSDLKFFHIHQDSLV